MQVSTRVDRWTKLFIERATKILSSGILTKPFRVLSIGCGDGTIDHNWLSVVVKKFPDVRFQYVGVDVNEQACNITEEKLNTLKHTEVSVYCRDITQGLSESPFDLILAVSSFYYLSSPEQALQVCKGLISPEGIVDYY